LKGAVFRNESLKCENVDHDDPRDGEKPYEPRRLNTLKIYRKNFFGEL
jgi:hypothetical protein